MREIFAARLNQARREKGWTQLELAERTGIFKTLISRYELGKVIPRIDNVKRLADELGVRVGWLCGEDEAETGVADA